MHFSKKSGHLSLLGSENFAFGSHCSVNFQLILDCFIPVFKLEYEASSENVKAGRVNTVVLNLRQTKQRNFFGTSGRILI